MKILLPALHIISAPESLFANMIRFLIACKNKLKTHLENMTLSLVCKTAIENVC